jgi:hypothetical protein
MRPNLRWRRDSARATVHNYDHDSHQSNTQGISSSNTIQITSRGTLQICTCEYTERLHTTRFLLDKTAFCESGD